MSSLPNALRRLLSAPPPGPLFNPWTQCDPYTDRDADAAAQRLARLARHLDVDAQFVLVGEAAGYQGCKVSGLAFTSERLLLEGVIPRLPAPPSRLTLRARPWSEPSATTVWGTLQALGIADRTVLWNACPWHPHHAGRPHSNRPPTATERAAGVPVLRTLLAQYPRARLFAVGRNAQASLAELGIDAVPLRHPSMGGTPLFRSQLAAAVRARR